MSTEWEFGIPHASKDTKELYHRFSPDTYLEHWKTPTLVIHGAKVLLTYQYAFKVSID
jgi:acylaminoacyl-peptidase